MRNASIRLFFHDGYAGRECNCAVGWFRPEAGRSSDLTLPDRQDKLIVMAKMGSTPIRTHGLFLAFRPVFWAATLGLLLSGCQKHEEANREAAEAPPAAPSVVTSGEAGLVKVDQPQQFPLTTATTRQSVYTLNVTGAVAPDVSRELPVLSLANGRVVALHVGLGDYVRKGQLVMEVQSPDISTAFAGYLKAVNDERLTKVVLERDTLLYGKGAIAQSQLEIAQNAEDDSKTALTAAEQQLRILGVDKNQPGDTGKVYAPASGVVISQNVTAAGSGGRYLRRGSGFADHCRPLACVGGLRRV